MRIAIISGKGGSGKSSISAAFVSLCEKVVAVDCDVDASNLPLLFKHHVWKEEKFISGYHLQIDADNCVGCGICADNCAFHALEVVDGKAVVNPFFCEDCCLCERLCPTHSITLSPDPRSSIFQSHFPYGELIHGHLQPGDDNSGKMIAHLREIADKVMEDTHIDLQLLDGPPGIGCPVISTITGIDRIVIVTEPTRSGLSDLSRASQVAASFCKEVFVIINKCDINDVSRQQILDFCSEHCLSVLAELPFNKDIVDAQVAGKSIIEYRPYSPISQQLTQAFSQLTRHSYPNAQQQIS